MKNCGSGIKDLIRLITNRLHNNKFHNTDDYIIKIYYNQVKFRWFFNIVIVVRSFFIDQCLCKLALSRAE